MHSGPTNHYWGCLYLQLSVILSAWNINLSFPIPPCFTFSLDILDVNKLNWNLEDDLVLCFCVLSNDRLPSPLEKPELNQGIRGVELWVHRARVGPVVKALLEHVESPIFDSCIRLCWRIPLGWPPAGIYEFCRVLTGTQRLGGFRPCIYLWSPCKSQHKISQWLLIT